MFDPTTEAHLRLLERRRREARPDPLVPVAIVVTLLLWAGVLIAAL